MEGGGEVESSEPLTAEEQAYDGDVEGASSSANSSTAEGEEEARGIVKSHPGLDVPLGEVDEAKKAAARYARNAAKFDERGFRIMRKENASFTVGFDMFSEEEQKKREARAAKWGMEPPAKESEAAREARLQREKRAERFGVPLNDVVKKKEALKKTDLQTVLSIMDKRRKSLLKLDEQDQRVDPDPSVEVRPDALHLYGYMPLGTDDFMAALQAVRRHSRRVDQRSLAERGIRRYVCCSPGNRDDLRAPAGPGQRGRGGCTHCSRGRCRRRRGGGYV